MSELTKINKLQIFGDSNNGTTNILTLRDSDNILVFNINSDGRITNTLLLSEYLEMYSTKSIKFIDTRNINSKSSVYPIPAATSADIGIGFYTGTGYFGNSYLKYLWNGSLTVNSTSETLPLDIKSTNIVQNTSGWNVSVTNGSNIITTTSGNLNYQNTGLKVGDTITINGVNYIMETIGNNSATLTTNYTGTSGAARFTVPARNLICANKGGDVGINNLSPVEKLDVTGSIKLSENIYQAVTKYHYLGETSHTSDTIGDIRCRNNNGIYEIEKCTVANATKGLGSWTVVFSSVKEWEIYFANVLDEIEIIHETPITITSITLNGATSVDYSLDDGVNWTTWTTSVLISNTYSRWRVSNFGSKTDGTIIIKGQI